MNHKPKKLLDQVWITWPTPRVSHLYKFTQIIYTLLAINKKMTLQTVACSPKGLYLRLLAQVKKGGLG